MTVQITIGPPVLTINRGTTFVLTDYSGEIASHRAQGIFAEDTRFLSTYRLLVNGKPWQPISSAAVAYFSAQIILLNPELEYPMGVAAISGSRLGTRTIPYGTLGLELRRSVEGGIEEILQITNYGEDKVSIVLEMELASDFASILEVRGGQLRQRENIVTHWENRQQELVTTYRDRDFLRVFRYRVVSADHPPSHANGRLMFPIHLDQGQSWHAQAIMTLQAGARVHQVRPRTKTLARMLHERWLSACTDLSTPNRHLSQTYLQSVEDMGALRLFEHALGPRVWIPAAGVPWYVTPFGRDSLIASLQNMIVQPHFAEGSLRILAQYQAHKWDDWRDAQPGKIMHELRVGELAHFNIIPQSPYYGTWDATPLYLIALVEAWRWMGQRKLIDDLRPAAEGCLEWIDKYGDLDGDGFQEYKTYSSQGYENMSWKDAEDAVVYRDGRQVKQPKALCELQGYVYAAKRGMAEVFRVLGDEARARALEKQAADLKRRFNEVFWMEEEGTYVFGLDPNKQQIKTVASNTGHCLWTGIADEDKASRVVQRLLLPDMWSGWGIRTLSTKNPAYNPFSYQRGSVWPHDNGIIALGMKQYGFHREANQVARAIVDAASHFTSFRLPEVFAGLEREPHSFPAQYRGANIPQAWAAGSVFHLIRAMLGLRADAPNGRLWVNPTLPDWVPSLELSGLRVGKATLDLQFWREETGESRFAVKRQRGGRIDVRLEDDTIPLDQRRLPS